jgi:hypothetical protein
MSTATTEVDERWISFTAAVKILACGKDGIGRQIAAGRLTVRRLPGANPRLNEREVRELAAKYTGRVAVADESSQVE